MADNFKNLLFFFIRHVNCIPDNFQQIKTQIPQLHRLQFFHIRPEGEQGRQEPYLWTIQMKFAQSFQPLQIFFNIHSVEDIVDSIFILLFVEDDHIDLCLGEKCLGAIEKVLYVDVVRVEGVVPGHEMGSCAVELV
jgi:hypothetical protein